MNELNLVVNEAEFYLFLGSEFKLRLKVSVENGTDEVVLNLENAKKLMKENDIRFTSELIGMQCTTYYLESFL